MNGTQAQAGLAALLVHDAWVLWRTAHAAAAMSLEAVRGTPEPFDARIHAARPHPFQEQSAALLRELLADSEIRESHREHDREGRQRWYAPSLNGRLSPRGTCSRKSAT